MKKHLIISGVPRAGKSTVSRLLAKTCGYQHISMDSIIAGFERCFPETGVNTYADLSSMEILHQISGKMAPFLRAMMDSGEYDETDYGMVIDMYQLLPEDYVKHIDSGVCGITYFVTAEVTPEERFRLLKQFDTPDDYSYHTPDAEQRENCVYLVEQSRLIREQCRRFGLPCYETSKNRDAVLTGFLNSLIEANT